MDTKEERYQKGIQLLKAENYDQALKVFNQLIKEFPLEADYWSERGVVYFHLKNKTSALFDMDKAVELQPKKSYRYSSRAYIRGHYKMTNEAIDDYKMAIELDPEDAVAQNNLGMLEEQLGYNSSSKNRFDRADNIMKEMIDGRSDQGLDGEQFEARNIQKEIDAENLNKSLWSELKQIASKEGRKSFIKFISSGFKKT